MCPTASSNLNLLPTNLSSKKRIKITSSLKFGTTSKKIATSTQPPNSWASLYKNFTPITAKKKNPSSNAAIANFLSTSKQRPNPKPIRPALLPFFSISIPITYPQFCISITDFKESTSVTLLKIYFKKSSMNKQNQLQ